MGFKEEEMVPTISAYTWWNRQTTNDSCKSRSPSSCEVAELILISTTKALRRRPDRTQLLLFQMAGDVHPNPGPTSKYPCPVCTRNVTSRGASYQCTRCSGWVHAKCSGLLNAAQYRGSKDWTCDPCSASKTQQSLPRTPCSICRTN